VGQHLPVGPAGGGQLHGQAVGLLAVGAAGAPDDHRALKGRQDLAAEGGELVGMAEEPGLLHGHAVQHRLEGVRVAGQAGGVPLRGLAAGPGRRLQVDGQPGPQPVAEPQPGPLGQQPGRHLHVAALGAHRRTLSSADVS
jgi:hypothetical protein